MTWRFDNRKNPFLFRDIMLNLIASDNLQYKGTHLSRCLGIEHCCQSLISAAVITGFNLVSHKQYGTSPFMPSSPIQPAQRNTYIPAVPSLHYYYSSRLCNHRDSRCAGCTETQRHSRHDKQQECYKVFIHTNESEASY